MERREEGVHEQNTPVTYMGREKNTKRGTEGEKKITRTRQLKSRLEVIHGEGRPDE